MSPFHFHPFCQLDQGQGHSVKKVWQVWTGQIFLSILHVLKVTKLFMGKFLLKNQIICYMVFLSQKAYLVQTLFEICPKVKKKNILECQNFNYDIISSWTQLQVWLQMALWIWQLFFKSLQCIFTMSITSVKLTSELALCSGEHILNENKMFMGLIDPLSNICQIINQTFFFRNNLVKSKIQK